MAVKFKFGRCVVGGRSSCWLVISRVYIEYKWLQGFRGERKGGIIRRDTLITWRYHTTIFHLNIPISTIEVTDQIRNPSIEPFTHPQWWQGKGIVVVVCNQPTYSHSVTVILIKLTTPYLPSSNSCANLCLCTWSACSKFNYIVLLCIVSPLSLCWIF